jgi:hypothetical protein
MVESKKIRSTLILLLHSIYLAHHASSCTQKRSELRKFCLQKLSAAFSLGFFWHGNDVFLPSLIGVKIAHLFLAAMGR